MQFIQRRPTVTGDFFHSVVKECVKKENKVHQSFSPKSEVVVCVYLPDFLTFEFPSHCKIVNNNTLLVSPTLGDVTKQHRSVAASAARVSAVWLLIK